jgi:putative FmdB family regulatory protein
MPIYVYKCGCGARFERLMPLDAPAPGCPACGEQTRKIPAGFSLGGQADAGLSQDRMPQTWRGTYHGDREYVTGLQRQWEKRRRLEERHPEIAGDQRPILAHEGRYHDAPLRAGDPILGATPAGHGHGHGPGSAADPAAKPASSPASSPPPGPAGE